MIRITGDDGKVIELAHGAEILSAATEGFSVIWGGTFSECPDGILRFGKPQPLKNEHGEDILTVSWTSLHIEVETMEAQ